LVKKEKKFSAQKQKILKQHSKKEDGGCHLWVGGTKEKLNKGEEKRKGGPRWQEKWGKSAAGFR